MIVDVIHPLLFIFKAKSFFMEQLRDGDYDALCIKRSRDGAHSFFIVLIGKPFLISLKTADNIGCLQKNADLHLLKFSVR